MRRADIRGAIDFLLSIEKKRGGGGLVVGLGERRGCGYGRGIGDGR